MSYTPETLQLLAPDGTRVVSEATEAYLPYVDALTEQQLREFYRTMRVIRRFDIEAGIFKHVLRHARLNEHFMGENLGNTKLRSRGF